MIILAVIFVSGCIGDSDNNNSSTNGSAPLTIAKNGVLIKYPGDWVIATSGSNDSIVAVADPNSKDSGTGLSNVNVNIERRSIPSSLVTYFNQTYTKLFSNSDYTQIAQGNTSIGSYTALEAVYTQDVNGTIKQHRALWIEHNNEVYVILCTAPQNEFQNQLRNFDLIISSFRIT